MSFKRRHKEEAAVARHTENGCFINSDYVIRTYKAEYLCTDVRCLFQLPWKDDSSEIRARDEKLKGGGDLDGGGEAV